jgi:hypothetical protein
MSGNLTLVASDALGAAAAAFLGAAWDAMTPAVLAPTPTPIPIPSPSPAAATSGAAAVAAAAAQSDPASLVGLYAQQLNQSSDPNSIVGIFAPELNLRPQPAPALAPFEPLAALNPASRVLPEDAAQPFAGPAPGAIDALRAGIQTAANSAGDLATAAGKRVQSALQQARAFGARQMLGEYDRPPEPALTSQAPPVRPAAEYTAEDVADLANLSTLRPSDLDPSERERLTYLLGLKIPNELLYAERRRRQSSDVAAMTRADRQPQAARRAPRPPVQISPLQTAARNMPPKAIVRYTADELEQALRLRELPEPTAVERARFRRLQGLGLSEEVLAAESRRRGVALLQAAPPEAPTPLVIPPSPAFAPRATPLALTPVFAALGVSDPNTTLTVSSSVPDPNTTLAVSSSVPRPIAVIGADEKRPPAPSSAPSPPASGLVALTLPTPAAGINTLGQALLGAPSPRLQIEGRAAPTAPTVPAAAPTAAAAAPTSTGVEEERLRALSNRVEVSLSRLVAAMQTVEENKRELEREKASIRQGLAGHGPPAAQARALALYREWNGGIRVLPLYPGDYGTAAPAPAPRVSTDGDVLSYDQGYPQGQGQGLTPRGAITDSSALALYPLRGTTVASTARFAAELPPSVTPTAVVTRVELTPATPQRRWTQVAPPPILGLEADGPILAEFEPAAQVEAIGVGGWRVLDGASPAAPAEQEDADSTSSSESSESSDSSESSESDTFEKGGPAADATEGGPVLRKAIAFGLPPHVSNLEPGLAAAPPLAGPSLRAEAWRSREAVLSGPRPLERLTRPKYPKHRYAPVAAARGSRRHGSLRRRRARVTEGAERAISSLIASNQRSIARIQSTRPILDTSQDRAPPSAGFAEASRLTVNPFRVRPPAAIPPAAPRAAPSSAPAPGPAPRPDGASPFALPGDLRRAGGAHESSEESQQREYFVPERLQIARRAALASQYQRLHYPLDLGAE